MRKGEKIFEATRNLGYHVSDAFAFGAHWIAKPELERMAKYDPDNYEYVKKTIQRLSENLAAVEAEKLADAQKLVRDAKHLSTPNADLGPELTAGDW